MKRSTSPNAQRDIGEIYLGILNHKQQFSIAVIRHKTRRKERLLMAITGSLGTGKALL